MGFAKNLKNQKKKYFIKKKKKKKKKKIKKIKCCKYGYFLAIP